MDQRSKRKTIKLFEENIGQKLRVIGLGNDFSDMAPQAEETKDKINKLDFVKTKKLCASKDTINRVKRQYREYKSSI